MSGVKHYNPNSRATEIIAALALREPLHSIERICAEQKQISTGRLYAYATEAGDKLAGYACELRQAITSLRQDHAEAQRLLRENDALAQRCKELEGLLAEATAQREFLDKQQSDACFRREKAESERNTLRAEVERLQRELATAHADASRYASRAEELRGELQEERSAAESVRFSAWRHGDFLSVRYLLGMFCSDGIAGVDQAGMEHVARKAADEVERLRRQAARYERQRRLSTGDIPAT